jgi:two-component system, LytTR family, sensor kinase
VNRPTSPARFVADQRARLLAAPPEWAAADARVDWRVAVGSIIAMWAIYFLITTGLAALAGAPDQVGLMGRRAIVVVFGALCTLILYLLLVRVQPRSFGARLGVAFGAAVPLTILYAIINLFAFFVWFPTEDSAKIIGEVQDKYPAAWQLVLVLDSSIRWYFFFAVWAALYVALGYANEMRAVEHQANTYRLEAKTAQLRALHYQVNPHFLFNTLNSLSSLVLSGRTADAEAMIQTLATFYRTSLTGDPTLDVPLAEEVQLQQLYLEVEAVRFPERLRTVFDIPDALVDACVPGLILQPLVENAVKHAVAATNRPVTITIAARAAGNILRLSVSDDGPGKSENHEGCGIGLSNVRDRLAARYGTADGLSVDTTPPGYRVVLMLPLTREGC